MPTSATAVHDSFIYVCHPTPIDRFGDGNLPSETRGPVLFTAKVLTISQPAPRSHTRL